jgi:hypothetical protein
MEFSRTVKERGSTSRHWIASKILHPALSLGVEGSPSERLAIVSEDGIVDAGNPGRFALTSWWAIQFLNL